MYSLLLYAHSWTRWGVLISATITFLFLFAGLLKKGPRAKPERIAQCAFIGFLDLQICLGLTLLFLSPLVSFSGAHPWIYQHVGGMILAATVLHGGNSYAKKISTPRAMRWAYVGANLLGIIFVLVSIPWPQSGFARPLFRF